ncbi:hypothetical protein SAMN02800692_3527 [Luteibacter sp. UNC138MFCol5.1]|uniref:DUF456 domain-containing protein n=1 Tax=Luteibacter sp. UNC138MFCol5.1 TaxID=1502774 RepID=UPI0008AE4415|nr:DUF456 domain-containing protein [Luteibacter sp. UNC138MFCol5.1]SEP06922.1 hypothetical protein SAMN02800692_3527 [Luteibacter sp. UNC138MFCol5.1]
MEFFLYLLSAALIVGGVAGAILPVLPGIPMIFGGIWLAAAVDEYRHLGWAWLVAIGIVAAAGIALDFVSASIGAKKIGASPRALWGAGVGTVIGMFFGIPGLIIGPFAGAVAGELWSGESVLRSAHVGVSTWIGMLVGILAKVVISFLMIGMAGLALLFA